MTFPIHLVNGPNLNMLGRREPEIYGRETLAEIESRCAQQAKALGLSLEYFQSNDEGALVSHLQSCLGKASGVIINAGAYTHTSIALRDALSMLGMPIIEVHLSNIYRREEFRHKSYISGVANGVICGFGAEGYLLALQAMASLIRA